MKTSSVTRRVLTSIDFREWAWWHLPGNVRVYVAAVPLAALALTSFAASQTSWRLGDLVKFMVLLGCGMVSVAARPRTVLAKNGLTKDFIPAWVLPMAILLPPVYAMITPIPLYLLAQWIARKSFFYRRVFSIGAIGLAYGAGSLVFRSFPVTIVTAVTGSSKHVLLWVLAVAVSGIVGWLGHVLLIGAAIKISNPKAQFIKAELNRKALQEDFTELDLGVMITIVVAANTVLAIVAIPTVLLIRRFMMHAQLLAKSRIDTKTGLLNSSTWETEAAIEVSRAIRTRSPAAVALIDIDHFKSVNDAHGHLVGDKALRAVTDAIREHLRNYDLAGRFGGEEFVVLLPHAAESDAISIAERLRTYVEAMAIPVGPADSCVQVRLTISIGVAALNSHTRELSDLIAAADAAMYMAKQSGRNRTHAAQVPAGAAVTENLGAEEIPGSPEPSPAPSRLTKSGSSPVADAIR
jgi:diguanylate cyclase (GGDEF)-like protein